MTASQLIDTSFIRGVRAVAETNCGHDTSSTTADEDECRDRNVLREFLHESIPCQDIVDNLGELLALHTYRTITGAIDREGMEPTSTENGACATPSDVYGPTSRVYEFMRPTSVITLAESTAGVGMRGCEDTLAGTAIPSDIIAVYSGADEIVRNIDAIRNVRDSVVRSASTSAKAPNIRVTRVSRNEIGSLDITVTRSDALVPSEAGLLTSASNSTDSAIRSDDEGSPSHAHHHHHRRNGNSGDTSSADFIDRICLCRCTDDPNSYWLRSMKMTTVRSV